MKKLLTFIFVMFLLVGTISAFDIDNTKDYDEEKRTLTITNGFGFGKKIAEIQLVSDLDNKVMAGNNVMVVELKMKYFDRSFKEYEDTLKLIELQNIKNDFKTTSKDLVFKYKVETIVQRDNYNEVCNEIGFYTNGTKIRNCELIRDGFREVTVERWIRFDKLNQLPKGEVNIGIFTNVEMNENIEWIPTDWFGNRVNEWASWNETLGNYIAYYWTLNGTTNSQGYESVLGVKNLSFQNSSTTNLNATFVPGKKGNALNISDGVGGRIWGNQSEEMTSFNGKKPFTINFWCNASSNYPAGGDRAHAPFFKFGNNSFDSGWGGGIYFQGEFDADQSYSLKINYTKNMVILGGIGVNGTKMHTITYDGVTTIKWYVNGTLEYTNSSTGVYMYEPRLIIGANPGNYFYFNGWIDEFAIFNTSLVQTQVNQLWNDGNGISYNEIEPPTTLDVTVILYKPDDLTSISTINYQNFSSNVVSVESNISNITLFLWYDNHTIFKTNTSFYTGFLEDVDVNLSISNMEVNNYYWNFYACAVNDSDYNCDMANNNRSFSRSPFTEDTNSYPNNTFETKSETIETNLSFLAGIDIVSANLVYNGSIYPGIIKSISSTKYNIKRTLDIPLITTSDSQNKSWYWAITYLDGAVKISSTTNSISHNVNLTLFDKCGASIDEYIVVNYTIYEEGNESAKKVSTTRFDASFDYYLGSGSVMKTNYSNNESLSDSFRYCSNTNLTLKVNPSISLSATGYSNRRYDIIKELYNNLTSEISLFMINNTVSSSIIVEVKDSGFIPIVGYNVKIFRYYPETNEYKFVESHITDNNGQFPAKLVQNDIKYKFEFYNGDGVLKKTKNDVFILCKASICVIPFVLEEDSTDFDYFDDLTDYSYSLTFSNSSNTFSFAWVDNRGENQIHRLEVVRYNSSGLTIVCNKSSANNNDILSCAVGSSKAEYKSQVFRRVDSIERRIALLWARVGQIFSTFGKEGLFWMFILLFTLVGIGSFSPVVGIALYLVGFFTMGMLGIFSMPYLVLISTMLIGGIIIYIIRM